MKKRIKLYGGMGLICLFLFACASLGCGKKQIVVDSAGMVVEDQAAEAGETNGELHAGLEGESGNAAASEGGSLAGQSEEDAVKQAVQAAEGPGNGAGQELPAEEAAGAGTGGSLWVHICGEVLSPGVYELPSGSRIYDAIREAGGVTEKGDGDYLNQASPLSDGMKITVPSFTEVKEWENRGETGIQASEAAPAAGSGSGSEASSEAEGTGSGQSDGRVDINTADEAALCTLPGIGSARAKSIIAYREEKGPFSRIEEIMNVSGIKEAAFAKIKEYIKVS